MEGSPENEPAKLRLKALRKRRQMTQTALSEAADVPLRTLKEWEKENQPQAVDTAVRLAAALGVSLDELAGIAQPVQAQEPPRVVVDGVEYVPANGAGEASGVADAARVLGPAEQPERKQPRHSPQSRRSGQTSPEE